MKNNKNLLEKKFILDKDYINFALPIGKAKNESNNFLMKLTLLSCKVSC